MFHENVLNKERRFYAHKTSLKRPYQSKQAKGHNWTFWNKIKKQNILYVSP